MKKDVILISLVWVCFSVFSALSAVAKEQDFLEWVFFEEETKTSSLQEGLDGYQGNGQTDEVIIKRLLSIPKSYRAYVFPMLFEYPVVLSKQVLTHPEILPYQGRFPDEINKDVFMTYKQEDLKFLPAYLYPLLAPSEVKVEFYDGKMALVNSKNIEKDEK